MVMENTTAVKEIIACTMADRNERAPAGGPGNSSTPPDGRRSVSTTISSTAMAIAPATHTAGTSHTVERSTSATRLLDASGRRFSRRLAGPTLTGERSLRPAAGRWPGTSACAVPPARILLPLSPTSENTPVAGHVKRADASPYRSPPRALHRNAINLTLARGRSPYRAATRAVVTAPRLWLSPAATVVVNSNIDSRELLIRTTSVNPKMWWFGLSGRRIFGMIAT